MPSPSVIPALRYDDPDVAIRFLVDAFGFREHATHRGDAGTVVHAELAYGDGMVMLGSGGGAAPGCGHCYVVVEDADAHHARALAAGAEIVRGLADMDYGSREYGARDPEGHTWSFGTYRPQAG